VTAQGTRSQPVLALLGRKCNVDGSMLHLREERDHDAAL